MSGALDGKVAVITGAASGLGQAAALRFAEEGARLALCDANEEALEKTRAQVAERGAEVTITRVDLRNIDEIASFAQGVSAHYGKVDALYNSAGIRSREPLEEVTPEQWDNIFAVNTRGSAFMIQHMLPLFKAAGGGVIVNTASSSAVMGSALMAVYTASKGAIVSMTRGLAREFGPINVRVFCICPGPIDTAMFHTQNLAIPEDQRESVVAASLEKMVIKRVGRPEEVAAVVTFLASDESSFLTGLIIPVDGGVTL